MPYYTECFTNSREQCYSSEPLADQCASNILIIKSFYRRLTQRFKSLSPTNSLTSTAWLNNDYSSSDEKKLVNSAIWLVSTTWFGSVFSKCTIVQAYAYVWSNTTILYQQVTGYSELRCPHNDQIKKIPPYYTDPKHLRWKPVKTHLLMPFWHF